MTVVLEPISANIKDPGVSGGHQLLLGHDDSCTSDDFLVKYVRAGSASQDYPSSHTTGCGVIEAYGIDVATIATTMTRAGTFTFDLGDYDTGEGIPSLTDLFDTDCGGVSTLNGLTVSGCLEKQITATFTDPGGNAQSVSGLLYWEASSRTNDWYNDFWPSSGGG